MAADDFLNQPTDQGLPAETDPASSMSGNRPASGARRATPGEVLSQGFHGAQSAGDFLGLDTEFAGQDPLQGYGGLDTVPPPGTYAEPGAYVPQAPAPLPDGDAMQEFAQAPSAFEFGEDLGSEEGEIAYEGEAQSKKPLLVAALVVAGLVAGGVMYGPQLYSRFRGGETKVAEAPRKPAPARAPVEAPAPPAPEVRLDPAVTEPIAKPEPLVPASSLDDPLLTSADGTPPSASSDPLAEQPAPLADAEPAAPADLETAIATGVDPDARPGVIGFPDLTGAEYEWASEDQLELIWRGSEVPLEAVRAPAKTLMPRVGSVRVFTTEDEIFEGRLYAVGQNRVWIDAEPGRIGLDGERVERIEVLPPAPEGQLVAGADAPVPGAKRVRVRVPGGMLYGSVLKTEGEDVTLALETGGRVRVKAGDVQELGSGRAVVVRN